MVAPRPSDWHTPNRGRDGKPVYISGPHDDADMIIRKLRRGLGDGNYDFVHMTSG